MNKVFSQWGAVIIIGLLFVGSWIGQWLTQWTEYMETAAAHGEQGTMSGFMPEFWAATFENWQSEFLQLSLQAILIASFLGKYIFQADHGADKDDIARLEAKIDRLK